MPVAAYTQAAPVTRQEREPKAQKSNNEVWNKKQEQSVTTQLKELNNKKLLSAKYRGINTHEHITNLRGKFFSSLVESLSDLKKLQQDIKQKNNEEALREQKEKLRQIVIKIRLALSNMRQASKEFHHKNKGELIAFTPKEKEILSRAVKHFSICRGALYKSALQSKGISKAKLSAFEKSDRLKLNRDIPNIISSKILDQRDGVELNNFLRQVGREIIREAPREIDLERPGLVPIDIEKLLVLERGKILEEFNQRAANASAGTVLQILKSANKLYDHKAGKEMNPTLKSWRDDFLSTVIKKWAKRCERGKAIDEMVLNDIKILYSELPENRRYFLQLLSSQGLPSSHHSLTQGTSQENTSIKNKIFTNRHQAI